MIFAAKAGSAGDASIEVVLAVIGFITVLKYGVITLIGMTADFDDDVYTKLYPSPNGHYSAALVSRSGGGAIAPFVPMTWLCLTAGWI
ncbi:hypothetical protein [Pseudomonas sp. ACM7]|uniref:hypothetical protein n=1 Tax=Pseudomonas sp. ACM7 TaxID=2052956 RepID=UPI0010123618|nr:hypothetical protein [Pseudomonas sp. ACM7]QAY88991.1 hypothetical protein CUN63_03085 [Pseudomonas sp. ACM7]